MAFNNDKAIYLQIADRLSDEILVGTYKAFDRIPSVREYAAKLGVNANTAVKAYDQTRTGRGHIQQAWPRLLCGRRRTATYQAKASTDISQDGAARDGQTDETARPHLGRHQAGYQPHHLTFITIDIHHATIIQAYGLGRSSLLLNLAHDGPAHRCHRHSARLAQS